MVTPKNARGRPVTKLCLALEAFRRTEEGRTRDAKAFLGHFFPQDNDGTRDRLFVHMPKEVRADLLSNWGIRGKKSALRDDDEKVRITVTDALAAGDIDATIVEASVTPEVLVDWVPLEDWWRFWRGTPPAPVPVVSVRKALAVARELSLFDERWFFDHLKLGSQKLDGTDVVCAALSKDQVSAWIRAVHESGDASPTGLVSALGWETVLSKTANEALTSALDALARQIGLVDEPAERRVSDAPRPISERPVAAEARSAPAAKPEPAMPARQHSKPVSKPAEPSKPPPLPVTPKSSAPSTSSSPVLVTPIQVVATTPGRMDARADGTGMLTHDLAPAVIASAPAAPVSSPPDARALFGVPAHLPPMRPPAATLSGVGAPPLFEGSMSTSGVAENGIPGLQLSGDEPAWAPPRAEPGDMGWDLVHGVKRPMSTHVQPKYNFDDDDEPTSEIALPGDSRRPRA